jgi:kynurenine formamidase
VPLPEEFHELARQVTNWGRWGPDDERGTLNLLTPQVVARAATCVRSGKRFSLALPLSADGPQIGLVPGRINPQHAMIAVNSPMTDDPDAFRSSDDTVLMGLQAATHWDALAHVSYGGHLYNGHPADAVTTEGALRCGIDKAGSIVGRGVLLDIARARGVERLEPGSAITPDDLDAAEELARLRVGPGDLLLVRTGQIQVLHAGDKMGYAFPSPGLTMATVPWLRARDVAAVATDNLTLEVYPGERDDLTLPVHMLHLVDMGLTQGQNFDLEALAADCADDGAYAFLLDASPQPFQRALGSPVNPVAVK